MLCKCVANDKRTNQPNLLLAWGSGKEETKEKEKRTTSPLKRSPAIKGHGVGHNQWGSQSLVLRKQTPETASKSRTKPVVPSGNVPLQIFGVFSLRDKAQGVTKKALWTKIGNATTSIWLVQVGRKGTKNTREPFDTPTQRKPEKIQQQRDVIDAWIDG